MFVCCVSCVLSGRGLCDELITRPEESYKCGVSLCVIKKSRERGGHSPRWVAGPQKIINNKRTLATSGRLQERGLRHKEQ
jgi:hypothetical protein